VTAPVDDVPPVPGGPAPTETQFVPDALGPHATQIVDDAAAFAPRARPASHAPPAASELPRFGRFAALAPLGAGVTGSVYRAHDDVLGRAVAIKVLHAQGELAVRERFLNEARAVGAVAHPNIVAIYDVGTDAAAPYLVMELAVGGSLRDRLQRGPLALDAVRTIGIQIARALAAAHAANILHRDVKPANILCCGAGGDATTDVWKLADFGIARLPDSTLTLDGQFLGSPAYAAPEALRAGLFSPASDVYGLGATLYEALAGEPPHGDQDVRVIVRKLDEDVRPLPAFVPRPFAAAILATLARDPARRPSADQLARLLATSALVPVAAPRAWPRVVAIGAALVAIALWIVLFTRDRAPAAASPPPATAKAIETARPTPAQPTPTDEPTRDLATPESTAPGEPAPPAAPREPSAPTPDLAEAPEVFAAPPGDHVIVDEHGHAVDDELARELLERMERDARAAYERRGRGRGRARWRRDD